MRLLSRFEPAAWFVLTAVVVIVAFVAATLYATHVGRVIDEMADDLADDAYPSIRHLTAVRAELDAMDDVLTAAVLAGTGEAPPRAAVEAHQRRMREALDSFARLPTFPTERRHLESVDLRAKAVEVEVDDVLAKLEAGDVAGALRTRAGPLAAALQSAGAALDETIAFEADEGAGLGTAIGHARHRAMRTAFAFDFVAGALTLTMAALMAWAVRQRVGALRRAHDAEEAMTARLRRVARAALAITERVPGSDRGEDVLRTAVETAAPVVGADLAAIGMGNDPSRPFDPFVSSGVEPSLMDALGHAPRPLGVLGALVREGRTLRVDDVTGDPRFASLPRLHPSVGPLLGVVIRADGGAAGHLYLAKRPGAAPFTEQDAGAIELLATFVNAALQNATLYAAVKREVAQREDLLSMVSHDLRNPLSAVALAARLLGRALRPEEPASRHVEIVARNVTRMERLIADLLTAAKVREGHLVVELRAEETVPVLTEAVDACASTATEKRIELRLEAASDLPPVLCDRERILQVLSNLLGNALKFTAQGGSVVLSASVPAPSREEVRISVRDTGIGIEESALPHVFDRYWQKREHAAGGTGLGLFIAKGIVELHRGRIWVESRPGEGSNFQFTVPAAS
jgi:signal transduction histidine kinase